MWIHTKERGDFSGTSALFAVDRTAVQTNGDILLLHDKRLRQRTLYTTTHTRDHRQTADDDLASYQDVYQSTGKCCVKLGI